MLHGHTPKGDGHPSLRVPVPFVFAPLIKKIRDVIE